MFHYKQAQQISAGSRSMHFRGDGDIVSEYESPAVANFPGAPLGFLSVNGPAITTGFADGAQCA
jgi:hypothetical protein